MAFIPGIELSRRFHGDVVAPWMQRGFPGLPHAAALIGAGSELLGFDDEMSRDHDWGARVQIYLTPADFAANGARIATAFAAEAPAAFLGAPLMAGGVQVSTLEARLHADLDLAPDEPADALAWLGLSEQRLLAFTSGAVFRDDAGRLTAARARLAWFPRDVWLYKLACQWRRIAEEQAFVGRAGMAGDDLGSRVIAARLARDVMRLGFLIEGRYAPYAKWLGTAFARLPRAAPFLRELETALAAPDWPSREAALARAYMAAARLHQARGLPGGFEPALGPYHDRPFKVINADAISHAIQREITDPILAALPLMGSLDQITDATPLTEAPAAARRAMAALFDHLKLGTVEKS